MVSKIVSPAKVLVFARRRVMRALGRAELDRWEVLRELCLEPLGISVTKAAAALGVSRKTLSAILNGRAGISPEMAVRLSLAFDTPPESWLNQQAQYDLWLVSQKQQELKVERLTLANAA